jgi:hypothetical protein
MIPSNEDARFDRVRARRALAAMAEVGAGGAEIAALAAKMADVRAALEAATADAAARILRVDAGDVIVDVGGLAALPAEIRRRLLLAALIWIASAEYGPRGAEMERFVAAALEGRPATLAGCKTSHARGRMRVTRELRAVAGWNARQSALGWPVAGFRAGNQWLDPARAGGGGACRLPGLAGGGPSACHASGQPVPVAGRSAGGGAAGWIWGRLDSTVSAAERPLGCGTFIALNPWGLSLS